MGARAEKGVRGARLGGGLRLDGALASVRWPNVAGFALVQAWTVLCIALPDPVTYGQQHYLDLRWVSLLTALALSAAVALCRPLAARAGRSRALFAAAGAVASAASLLGPVSALFEPPLSGVLIHLAAVGVGVGFAWLYAVWYGWLCAARDMIGLVFSAVASLLLIYPLANVLSTDQISPWISATVGSALPMLSVALAFAAGDGERPAVPGAAEEPEGPAGVDPAELRRRRLLCLRFGMCLCAVVAVVEVARNLLLGGTAIAFYAGVANLGGATLKVACAVPLVAVFANRDARGVSVAYRCSFVLLLGVVLCLPLLLQGNWFAHMLLDVGSFFFQMVVLMVAYQISAGFGVSAVRVFGALRAVWAAGALLGIGVPHLAQACVPGYEQVLAVVLGLTAAVAFLFMFTDRDCVEVLASLPAEAQVLPGFEEKAARLAHRHGVTEREAEVMLLVARGRSAARIAETLGVSAATVNSHVHRVYQKLDVHSRQELMDAIEREGEANGAA